MANKDKSGKLDEKELKESMGEDIAILLKQLKEDYFEQTKYLSIPSKIDFIKGELKDVEIVEMDRSMLSHYREVVRYCGSVNFEGNRLFREFLENELHKLEKALLDQKTQPQQIQFEFINNFDHVLEEKIYKYFHEKLVKGKFINEDTLHTYLELAFEKQTAPAEMFDFLRNQTKTTSKVRKIFYKYWNELAGHQHGTKDRYVKLYTNYFNGFKFESEKTNFSK